jgi:dihydroorotate dehydrogenase
MTRAVPTLYPLMRRVLFRMPAETAHEVALETLAHLPSPGRAALSSLYSVRDERLRTTVCGIDFPNPVGLAAGFDKSGRAFEGLAALGFGFVEIGTVTALSQEGNPRPRLFRLPEDDALLNRMGFNNPGAEEVAERLGRQEISVVLGVNVGKSKVTPLERAAEDYVRSIDLLEPYASYLVINVSSPNTPGLRELQDAGPLRELLEVIAERGGPGGGLPRRPVFLKLAPDLSDPQLDQAVDIALEQGIAGLIAVNTTVGRDGLHTPEGTLRELGAGGISGAPLRTRAREVVARVYRKTGGRLPVIGVGGIFDADDAWDRIRAGASLVQVYTGLIYGGPGLVRRINRGLLRRMEEAGFGSIAEAVGTSVR